MCACKNEEVFINYKLVSVKRATAEAGQGIERPEVDARYLASLQQQHDYYPKELVSQGKRHCYQSLTASKRFKL